ncbi:hypothetical protein KABACHOK_05560 [Brevundimonas phage vB_BpoS-Kabachok]|uniref:Uncharacterized protein n=1 Tax=Brevundimonas phage vB_BpoS-Kabachok TaxID=2948600 RepID=A0A9E7MQ59_9CAUD|nr:hypothetical protein KABACHOK_05560 [Brevundimonas phage vB_BpoS-Kabachok]
MSITYPALIRAAAAQVLALRHNPTPEAAQGLIGRLYGIAESIERGDPAESIAGDPAQFIIGDPRESTAGDPAEFIVGDPAEFIVGDPAQFSHLTLPEVREVLAAGPDGEWTARHTQAVLLTFDAFDADQADPDTPDRTAAAEALHDAYLPATGDRQRARAWAALYRYWMDRDPPASALPAPETLPYRATFQGQAWIMDHAIAADEARHAFYVSQAEVEACFDREKGVYDELSDAALAPAEVRNWQGPFDIQCERRPYRIEPEQEGAPILYADDAAGVRARLLDLFQADASAEGTDYIAPDLRASIMAFEGLKGSIASEQFASRTTAATVVLQDEA